MSILDKIRQLQRDTQFISDLIVLEHLDNVYCSTDEGTPEAEARTIVLDELDYLSTSIKAIKINLTQEK
jgi:hypothetical protein